MTYLFKVDILSISNISNIYVDVIKGIIRIISPDLLTCSCNKGNYKEYMYSITVHCISVVISTVCTLRH